MLSLHSPSAILQSISVSWRGAFTHAWCPGFCECCPGDTFRLPGSGRHWDLGLWSHWTVYLHTLKSCCLRIWLPISLNLGVEILPSKTLTDRSWHTLNYWEPLKVGCLDNHKGVRDKEELGCRLNDKVFVSSMRPRLQDWERWLLYQMRVKENKERNMLQMKEQDKTSEKSL